MTGKDITSSVLGGSGFTGGELIRLISIHPSLELKQATSRRFTRKTIGYIHPNLRSLNLRFNSPEDLEEVDVLYIATPHGVSMKHIDKFRRLADKIVDLSADFRLQNEEIYNEWYNKHERPELLSKFVYGLPELHREEISNTNFVSCGGCNSTVTILGLYPLLENQIIDGGEKIIVDIKVGSSEGGAESSMASHHTERSGIVRPYAPIGHRHEAEIQQELGINVSFTAHAVDMIRGASATCHVYPENLPSKSDLWKAFREQYQEEPFVRLVGGGGKIYKYPEPKTVAGTNYVEIGFEIDEKNERIVIFSAIDNMMKGSAGQAIHASNIMLDLKETLGLKFQGLHPVGAP